MRFQRGIHYPHPPRGPARRPYTVSPEALLQRRNNLRRTRIRSDRESLTIKRLIWQPLFECGPRPSQRTLACQLGVRPSYIFKVQRKAQTEGMATLVMHERATLDGLAKAREFTAKLREEGVLAPAHRRLNAGEARGEQRRPMNADESIAEQRRLAEEWKRKNLARYGGGRRIAFSVPVRW